MSAEQSLPPRTELSAHTPGPWHHDLKGNFGNCVAGQSGKKLYEFDDGFRPIALVQHCTSSDLAAAQDANQAANIALIAAAPDLLACLQALRWKSTDKDNMEFQCAVSCWEMDAIRAAIAKATGAA
jgi:hypothetical protein